MNEPALPPGARILRRGSFRLDRERAQEKIAKFQLDDPRAYVLELIAAGVCAGAQQIELRAGPRDLEVWWDGDAPTRPELGDLFDWVFTAVQSRRARMMQHLAQAIYGARGVSPAAIVLDAPGLRADLTDPLRPDFGEAEAEQHSGLRLVVRARLELLKHTVDAVTWVFGQAQELRLLRRRAALCPTPIHVGGGHKIGVDRLALPTASKFHYISADAFLWIEVFEGDGSRLSDRHPALLGTRTTVAIVRDGVTIDDHDLRRGDVALCGWVHADELQLDVSQARVVQDGRWQALLDQLVEIREELTARHQRPLHAPVAPPTALAPVRRAAFAAMAAAEAATSTVSETNIEDEERERPEMHAEPDPPAAKIATESERPAVQVEIDEPPAPVVVRPDAATIARSPLAALRLEVEAMLAVAVDPKLFERTCEALLRELPRLGVAFLRDPAASARVVLAWQIADRLLLASERPAAASEMALRIGHALELVGRPGDELG